MSIVAVPVRNDAKGPISSPKRNLKRLKKPTRKSFPKYRLVVKKRPIVENLTFFQKKKIYSKLYSSTDPQYGPCVHVFSFLSIFEVFNNISRVCKAFFKCSSLKVIIEGGGRPKGLSASEMHRLLNKLRVAKEKKTIPKDLTVEKIIFGLLEFSNKEFIRRFLLFANSRILRFSIKEGYIKLVKKLLSYSIVNPGALNNESVVLACREKRKEILKLLLSDDRIFLYSNWIDQCKDFAHNDILNILNDYENMKKKEFFSFLSSIEKRVESIKNDIDDENDYNVKSLTRMTEKYKIKWHQLGEDVNELTNTVRRILRLSISKNDIMTFRFITNVLGVDPTYDEEALLSYAVRLGRVKVLKELLKDERVNSNWHIDDYLESTSNVEIVEILMNSDVRNNTSRHWKIALKRAIELGKLKMIHRILVEKKKIVKLSSLDYKNLIMNCFKKTRRDCKYRTLVFLLNHPERDLSKFDSMLIPFFKRCCGSGKKFLLGKKFKINKFLNED